MGLRILSIGGLDPCGGAGITADARMVQARGGQALTVATCLTIQNRHGVERVDAVAEEALRDSLGAALGDGVADAIKLGLMTTRAFDVVVDLLDGYDGPVVADPVLGFTAGGEPPEDLVSAYRERLVVLHPVLTPNLDEIEKLAPAGGAGELIALGCRAVLVKGGHGVDDIVLDLLHDEDGEFGCEHPRRNIGPVHGTGCALATALAWGLASGRGLREACQGAIEIVQSCLSKTPPSADGKPVPLVIV